MKDNKSYVFKIICTPPQNEWHWQHNKVQAGGKVLTYQTLRLSHEMGHKIKAQLGIQRKGLYCVERFLNLESDFADSVRKYLEIYKPEKAYVQIV